MDIAKKGDEVFANDSVFRFEVVANNGEEIEFLSHSDGILTNGKGMHIRGINEKLPFLLKRDLELIELAHEFRLNYIWFFVLFFVMAFGLEFLGIYILLLRLKIRQISKINFAITLNARGGPSIVLASVGLYYEIINTDFFATLIFTTLLSSIIAGYFLRIIKAKDIFDKF